MNTLSRDQVLAMSAQAHAWTEQEYRRHPAVRGDAEWMEKQRLLMADMALHLLQTALRKQALDTQKLKKNLYSILTIADGFLPDHALKAFADQLYLPPATTAASEDMPQQWQAT
ncbi:hypothetical protein [Undibacterium squillarum]|uniref:hypothetical protein n=1 Tax=Undibacterium squillarum TaxID=1131567 RepID=UPI0035B03833